VLVKSFQRHIKGARLVLFVNGPIGGVGPAQGRAAAALPQARERYGQVEG